MHLEKGWKKREMRIALIIKLTLIHETKQWSLRKEATFARRVEIVTRLHVRFCRLWLDVVHAAGRNAVLVQGLQAC
jgi:hypothetical protein